MRFRIPLTDTLGEVIVYADDMEEMLDFYTDVLGLDHAHGDPEHGFVRLDAGSCSLCLHDGGDPDTDGTPPKLVFDVDDIQAARTHLEANGVAPSEIRSPAPGIQVVDAIDPEGNPFSLEVTERH